MVVPNSLPKELYHDVTYKMEKEDSLSRDTNDFNLIKMVQEMMSGKGWKNNPAGRCLSVLQPDLIRSIQKNL